MLIKINEGKVRSLSIRNLVRKITGTVKTAVSWVFKKIHVFLSKVEDKLLEKITEWGEKAADKLEVRLNGRVLEEEELPE